MARACVWLSIQRRWFGDVVAYKIREAPNRRSSTIHQSCLRGKNVNFMVNSPLMVSINMGQYNSVLRSSSVKAGYQAFSKKFLWSTLLTVSVSKVEWMNMQSNFIHLVWMYELVPAVLTTIQPAVVRIKWWSPSEKYSVLVIISILLTNLESLNKTEIKYMVVWTVSKNERKRIFPLWYC